jgi:hypothetical protein
MSKTSESIRAAAALIRAVADKATDGGWSHEHEGGHIIHGPDGTIAEAEYGPDGAHIALWDPDVARATSLVLDAIADGLEVSGEIEVFGHVEAAGLAALILGEVAS